MVKSWKVTVINISARFQDNYNEFVMFCAGFFHHVGAFHALHIESTQTMNWKPNYSTLTMSVNVSLAILRLWTFKDG